MILSTHGKVCVILLNKENPKTHGAPKSAKNAGPRKQPKKPVQKDVALLAI
ncbi:MAG: hypothetical protein ACQCN4_13700 [Candidatus Bathyarchaeia archaeon]